MVLSYAGDQDVGKTVVVVIPNRDSHPVHLHVKTGAAGNVGESAVAVIAVESKGGPLAPVPRPINAIHQQDVLPPIAVIVQEGAPRTQSFRQEFSTVGAAV